MKNRSPRSSILQRPGVQRVSLSLPDGLLPALDSLAERRGFASRSQAVASILQEHLVQERRENADAIMAGSITLFFRQNRPGILEEMATLKRQWVDEVIGTLQIQLEANHLMEVLLVQGPVRRLEEFTNQLVACRGVKTGRLTLTTELIPPLHPMPPKPAKTRPQRPRTKISPPKKP